MRYAQSQKIGKPNNLKIIGSNKTKGPKQDIQNQLKSPILLHSTEQPQILTCVILIDIFIPNSLDRAPVIYKWDIVSFSSLYLRKLHQLVGGLIK